MNRKSLVLLFMLLAFTACQPSEINHNGDENEMDPAYPLPVNIAHRGARSLAPENTLLAAQKGFDVGADMWELDVAMTYDGELVVIHDDTADRTSNAATVYPKKMPWNVKFFTLEELRTLDFGTWFIAEDPFKTIKDGVLSPADLEQMRNLQIPTLEEALVFTKNNNWRVNVEIKDLSGTPGDALVVEKVIKLIEQLDMVEDVILSSFNHEYLKQAKNLTPNVSTGALVVKDVDDPVALLQSLDAQAYNPGIKQLGDLSKIRLVREAGFDVYIWTVNDEVTMRRLIEAGVSGIFTDFPQLLNQVLAEYHD